MMCSVHTALSIRVSHTGCGGSFASSQAEVYKYVCNGRSHANVRDLEPL